MSVAVLSATMAGCDAAGRVAGCTPPPNEKRLLDTYEQDPVLRVADDRVDSDSHPGIRFRTPACRKIEPELDEPTITFVSVIYNPLRSYDAAALTAAYDRVATGEGWIRVTRKREVLVDGLGRKRSTDEPGSIWLWYCARPLGTLSYLIVDGTQPEELSSGTLSAMIRVARPGDPACP